MFGDFLAPGLFQGKCLFYCKTISRWTMRDIFNHWAMEVVFPRSFEPQKLRQGTDVHPILPSTHVLLVRITLWIIACSKPCVWLLTGSKRENRCYEATIIFSPFFVSAPILQAAFRRNLNILLLISTREIASFAPSGFYHKFRIPDRKDKVLISYNNM